MRRTFRSWLGLLVLAQLGLVSAVLFAETARAAIAGSSCPDAGIDVFESDMNVNVDVAELGMQLLILKGPVTILRGVLRMDPSASSVGTFRAPTPIQTPSPAVMASSSRAPIPFP